MMSKSAYNSETRWFVHAILTIGGSLLYQRSFSTENPSSFLWMYHTHDFTSPVPKLEHCTQLDSSEWLEEVQITYNDNHFRTVPGVLQTSFQLFTSRTTYDHLKHTVGNFAVQPCGGPVASHFLILSTVHTFSTKEVPRSSRMLCFMEVNSESSAQIGEELKYPVTLCQRADIQQIWGVEANREAPKYCSLE